MILLSNSRLPAAGRRKRESNHLRKKLIRSHRSKNEKTKYVICFDSSKYPTSLQKGKLYAVLNDEKADSLDMIRIIDDSGDSYLYSREYFESVNLSAKLEKALNKIFELA